MNITDATAKARNKMPTDAERVWLEYVLSDEYLFLEAVGDGDYDMDEIREALAHTDDQHLGLVIRAQLEKFAGQLCHVHTPEVYTDFNEDDRDAELDDPRHGQAEVLNREMRISRER